MIWLVLLYHRFKHKRVFIQQRNADFIWSGLVLWATPWTVALQVTWEDPDCNHIVYLPVKTIEQVRDFSPAAAVNALKDAYRDEPPDGFTV